MTAKAEVRERPILFSAPLVRAILEGRKTQTRRPLNPQPRGEVASFADVASGCSVWMARDSMGNPAVDAFLVGKHGVRAEVSCRYGVPGERLWVRETWCAVDDRELGGERWVDYRATPKYGPDEPAGWPPDSEDAERLRWRPSIFMPRWASRLTLEVAGVRVERLQEITWRAAIAEGIQPPLPISRFRAGWDGIYARKPELQWAANPWVWVVEFRRLEEGA